MDQPACVTSLPWGLWAAVPSGFVCGKVAPDRPLAVCVNVSSLRNCTCVPRETTMTAGL